jgi:hypothetical protein
MRSSSSVAPSAIAILSTALLCSLNSTATSQTTTTPQLPSVTVEAPKQVARPHRPVERPQRPARVANTVRAANPGASRQTSPTAQTPSYAPDSVMGKIAKLEKAATSCNGGCATSFKSGNAPWVGCSESGGYFSTFSPTCTDTLTYKSYIDCKDTKEFLGWDRNRAWWYCTSLAAGKKFQVAEVKRRR